MMESNRGREFDCIVAGSCVLDVLCRPVGLRTPIGPGALHSTEPLQIVAGGITANSGICMSRLGLTAGVLSYVGADRWGRIVREIFQSEGIDDSRLQTHPEEPTSTTIVAVDNDGERSFLHCVGAPRVLNFDDFLSNMSVWRNSRCLLLGYYSLLPSLEHDLPLVFSEVRKTGCWTALDAAGDGGSMSPLREILPNVDIWVPSRKEATCQTGLKDPEKMIGMYRDCGAPGVVGVKLGGDDGVLLSDWEYPSLHVPSCTPPAEVLDTTGAGDCFLAGLIAGLLQGMSLPLAGRLGCAAAASCVTAMGGHTACRSMAATKKVAGIKN